MENITKHIVKFIKSDTYLNNIFCSPNRKRKYNIELFIDTLVFILKTGISYRSIIKIINIYLYHSNINKNNINILLPHCQKK